MSSWIETAWAKPPHPFNVLVYIPGKEPTLAGYYEEEDDWWIPAHGGSAKELGWTVTHWMPMPDIPEQKGTAEKCK